MPDDGVPRTDHQLETTQPDPSSGLQGPECWTAPHPEAAFFLIARGA